MRGPRSGTRSANILRQQKRWRRYQHVVRFQSISVCSEDRENWCGSVFDVCFIHAFSGSHAARLCFIAIPAACTDRFCDACAADSGDLDSIISTVTSAGISPLDSAVAQRAQRQLLPSGGGPRGVGNYGSGGFGGSGGGAGTSAASAMDVEQVPAPAAGSGMGYGAGGGRYAEQIASLTQMGFDREAVTAVLEATQGSVEQAIQILTS